MAEVRLLEGVVAGSLLATLRNRDTDVADFRRAAQGLGAHLAAAAADHLGAQKTTVQSPLGEADAVALTRPVIVPVLRAGLGLLPGVLEVFTDAVVGMIGLARNETTLVADQYYRNVPPLDGRDLLVLEPMLATGGSASDALALLPDARSSTVLAVVATPAAIDRLANDHPDVTILVAAVDPGLNDRGWIVPGLGDFGDRLWGTV